MPKSKPDNSSSRPHFNIDGNVYVSAGVLMYMTDIEGKTYYLLQQREDRNYIEDLGGKSDVGDTSIMDVALREMLEELNCYAPHKHKPKNNVLSRQFLLKYLKQSEQILAPKSKYVLFLMKIPYLQSLRDLSKYGDCEYDSQGKVVLNRTLRWVEKWKLRKTQLHPRLRTLVKFF